MIATSISFTSYCYFNVLLSYIVSLPSLLSVVSFRILYPLLTLLDSNVLITCTIRFQLHKFKRCQRR
ncbi:hypothetical protein V1511DRAFT_504888 [Dipodascopsis uninucleata]